MRIRLFSDVHLEFADFAPPPAPADVVVLAGDIGLRAEGLAWARRHWPAVPVVYVLGNHEYYGAALPRLAGELRALGQDLGGVHVLEDDAVTLDGVTFLGSSLWTDLELRGAQGVARIQMARMMSDFRQIRLSPQGRPLRPKDTLLFHWRSRRWLTEELAARRGERVVVVTHHAPSARSLPPAQADSPLGAAYASDLEALVASSGAAAWLHGHTHLRSDYRLGETRVACNPRGYPGEETGFDPLLVLEV